MTRRHVIRVATALAWAALVSWGLHDTTTNFNPPLVQVIWTALAAVVLLGATATVWGDQR